MPTGTSTAAVRQHSVAVAGLVGVWAKLSGGDPSVSVAESWNGGAETADVTLGRKTIANVTVERPFNQARDRAMIRLVESYLGTSWTTTISDQDLDVNDQILGNPVVYTGCTPIKVSGPQYDTEKADGARFAIEFRVQSKV